MMKYMCGVEMEQPERNANSMRWYLASVIILGIVTLGCRFTASSHKLVGEYSLLSRFTYFYFPVLVVLPISLGCAAMGFVRGRIDIESKADAWEAFIGISSLIMSGVAWIFAALTLI